MDTLGPAAESLRLSEHYRRMTDEELIAIAGDRTKLTDLAQQALATEISQRRLTFPLIETDRPKVFWNSDQHDARDKGDAEEEPEANDPYAEDRQLIQICTVWSLDDAQQLQSLLDYAGIPFVMGLEKASRAEAVTSNFARGVPVGIMRIGWPWASQALERYQPMHVPVGEEEPKWDDIKSELAIHCPKCRSTDVIFDRVIRSQLTEGKVSEKYQWTCASCGREWEDDGLVS